MNHARDRRLRSGADIGCGAGNGARGRQAAEHRREDVGNPLTDQFDIGVVPVVAHAVRNHSRHQRLDGSEHSYGKSRSQESMHHAGVPMR